MSPLRKLSQREIALVDRLIKLVFDSLSIPFQRGSLYQTAWVSFLTLYRNCAAPSCFDWVAAFFVIQKRVKQQRSWNRSAKTVSFNQPVNPNIPLPRIQLLSDPRSNFQERLCFYDYLGRMETDLRRLAYGLIRGDTPGELQTRYHWRRSYLLWFFHRLQLEMEVYQTS